MPPTTPSNFMPRDTRSKETTASKTKQLYGLSLDASHLILSTLRDVARIAPVPYLMQAAQLALTILDTIQGMKDCREGFERLASDSCGLVYAISGIHTEGAASVELSGHINELLGSLRSILAFAESRLKSKAVLKVLRSNSDRGKIQEYREALRQSLDVFGLQSAISVRENISRIIKNQEVLSQQLRHQSAQGSNLKELLEEALDKNRAEDSQPPPPFPPTVPEPQGPPASRSKNPFHNPHFSRSYHVDTPKQLSGPSTPWGVPSGSAPQYYITGDFVSEDKSQHIKNTDSNNSTTTNVVASNNDSSIMFFAGPRGMRHRVW